MSMHAQLVNLVGRTEIQALNKPMKELLEVLKKHDGVVNAAKRHRLKADA